jgi:hypothetical protein
MPREVNFIINDNLEEIKSGDMFISSMYRGCYTLSRITDEDQYQLLYIEDEFLVCKNYENDIQVFDNLSTINEVKEFIRHIYSDYETKIEVIRNDNYSLNFEIGGVDENHG